MLLTLLMLVFLLPLTLFLLVLPYGVALLGGGAPLTLPIEMWRVATDRRRRRNQALEHATATILEERYGVRVGMQGFAAADGFVIRGPASAQAVLAAAREALERLQAGETRLALHPRSGTTLVGGLGVALLTFIGLLLLTRSLTVGGLLLAMMGALLAARWLARPVGLFLQRTLTTSADVSGLHIDHLDAHLPDSPLVLMLAGGQPTQFRIWTQEVEVQAPTEPRRFKAY